MLQVCLVGADGDAVLRRVVPIYDPVAAEQEALDICKVNTSGYVVSKACENIH